MFDKKSMYHITLRKNIKEANSQYREEGWFGIPVDETSDYVYMKVFNISLSIPGDEPQRYIGSHIRIMKSSIDICHRYDTELICWMED